MSAIRVGDRVRTPQGRICWTVTRLGESRGRRVAWVRSDDGKRQRYRTDRLVVLTATKGGHETPTPTYEEWSNGTILIDGEVKRGGDSTVAVVMEWQRPTERASDPHVPSVVTLARWSDNETPGGFLWVTASSDERCPGAQLTRRSALELATQLTNLAARME